jgi:nitroreductase
VSEKSNGAARADVFHAIVRDRRSVRGFLPKPVPQETLNAIFDIARYAPSNCNIQPWIVHVVSGEALERVRTAMVASAATGVLEGDFPGTNNFPDPTYRPRQIGAAKALYSALGIERGDSAGRMAAMAKNFEMFGAPHAAFFFIEDILGMREAIDCGFFAQNVLLAMAAHGVASCTQGAVSFVPDAIRKELNIPKAHKMLFGIAFGYEDTNAPANTARTIRAPMDENVTFHT